MKSPMLPADHQAAVRRVLALGRSGNPAALPDLIGILGLPSNEVQRLAASAIGKLAEFGADAAVAVVALASLAVKARHPQTQQYAIRALKKYAAAAGSYVQDLRDLARNPAQRDYVRTAAATTAYAIEQASARQGRRREAPLPALQYGDLGGRGCAFTTGLSACLLRPLLRRSLSGTAQFRDTR
jgi:hypothetical protein